MNDGLTLGGVFAYEIWTPDGRCRAIGAFPNGLANEGLNGLLDCYFLAGSQPAAFYIGIIDNADYNALSASDTMASHSGWIEITAYTQSTRSQWVPGAAASGLLTAPAAAEYTMSAGKTAKGLFVCSDSTKGGTSGTLWAHGLLDTAQELQVGETLKCYYELEARSG